MPVAIDGTEAWAKYFPEEIYDGQSILAKKVGTIAQHFQNNVQHYNVPEIRISNRVLVQLLFVVADDELMKEWSTIESDVFEKPDETLAIFALAMDQLCALSGSGSRRPFDVRLESNSKPSAFKAISIGMVDKLVVLNASVTRVGPLEHRCKWLAYRCSACSCSYEQAIKQTGDSETMPRLCDCPQRGTKSRTFIPLLTSPLTLVERCQTITVQEQLTSNQANRSPRLLKTELYRDFVDTVRPGDDITIHAIIRCASKDAKDKGAPERTLYLHPINLSIRRNLNEPVNVDFTSKEYGAIEAIRSQPCPFKLLMHSLCPLIYGHECVKAGLLLALFGGSQSATRRSQCHILVIGDPGLGKSESKSSFSFTQQHLFSQSIHKVTI